MLHSKQLHFKLCKLTTYSYVLREKSEHSVDTYIAKNDFDLMVPNLKLIYIDEMVGA